MADCWISFPGLGIGKFFINDYIISIFNFKIYVYAVIFCVAIIAGLINAYFFAEKVGVQRGKCLDVVFISLIFGILGARFYYVVFRIDDFFKNDEPFWSNLLNVFNLRMGGIAIYGGLIFAFLAGAIVCRMEKVKILPMLDLAGFSLPLAQSIGRWGNFFNVEAYGVKTNLPWGMMSNKIPQHLQPVHPTFFYESMWCFIGYILLMLLFKRRKFDGELFFIYLLWYGFERFFVEGLRTDSLMFFQTKIRVSQFISLVLVLMAVCFLIYFYLKFKKGKCGLYVKSKAWNKVLSSK